MGRRPKRSINFLMSDSPSSAVEKEEWWMRVEEWVGKQTLASANAKGQPRHQDTKRSPSPSPAQEGQWPEIEIRDERSMSGTPASHCSEYWWYPDEEDSGPDSIS